MSWYLKIEEEMEKAVDIKQRRLARFALLMHLITTIITTVITIGVGVITTG